jgi:hypothetical protein
MRGASPAGARDHPLLHSQLRARRIAHAAVPPVDAAPVCAPQAARHLGQLGCLQAQDRLELRRRLKLARIMLADFDPGVTAIAAQPFRLAGPDGAGTRRHVPDILLADAPG